MLILCRVLAAVSSYEWFYQWYIVVPRLENHHVLVISAQLYLNAFLMFLFVYSSSDKQQRRGRCAFSEVQSVRVRCQRFCPEEPRWNHQHHFRRNVQHQFIRQNE